MADFEWSDTFKLGVEEMDQEHFELISRIRRLAGLCKTTSSKDQILTAFDALISFTKKHFDDEELFMSKLQYPELETHKKLHFKMLEKLDRYRKEFLYSVYSTLPSSVFDFFETWLVTHILIVDKRYAEFASQNKS